MTAALIAVETEDFVVAARTLETDLADPLTDALRRLVSMLSSSGAMAGDDPGGLEWAHAYDRAAVGALNAGQAMADAVRGLAAMFVQTARNYAAADAASDAVTRGRVDVALATVPCISGYALPWCVPPSTAGGSGGAPHGWGVVEHLVGYVWPNGDPGRLRAAAQAWRGFAQELSSGQCVVSAAVARAVLDRIPEADDMTLVCTGLQNQLGEAAALFDSVAAACDELAGHIDEAHNAVEDELLSLLEWSAGIETAGAIASVFSFGAAEAPTQAVEAGRIAKTAASIASIIERFLTAARALARSVLRLAEQADRLAAAQVGLTGLRLSDVLVTTVSTLPATIKLRMLAAASRLAAAARGLPGLSTPLVQLEKKFKHAKDFGVLAPRGKAAFVKFGDALTAFVKDAKTIRIPASRGRYYSQPAIVNYNVDSKLVVVQHVDGTFWTCWRMTDEQLYFVRTHGTLGKG